MTTDENLISFRDIADQAKPHPMLEDIQTWLQTPVTPAQAGPIVVMGALLLVAVAGGLGAFGKVRKAQRDIATRHPGFLERWFDITPKSPMDAFLLRAVIAVFVLLFILALVATVLAVFDAIRGGLGDRPAGFSFSIGALLVALLGAPFLIWRTLVAQRTLEATQRQTELQDEDKRLREEAQFNDKINAAATDLAARRQVTRVAIDPNGDIVRDKEGKETILTEWQDDLVTRAAAIDRLEGLAQEAIERDDYPPAQRIARMLSIYVQELSREYPPKPAPEFESREQLQGWAKTLQPVLRPDMERAAQSLGRINPRDPKKHEQFNPDNIDLRRCNLQGFDLSGMNFNGAKLGNSYLGGAKLFAAELRKAFLAGAQLQCANLDGVQMQQAFLGKACLDGAHLRVAYLQGIGFENVKLRGADIRTAKVSEKTDLSLADFRGAAISNMDAVAVDNFRPHWPVIFADGTLRDHVTEADWPAHWPREELDYEPWNEENSPFHIAWRAWQATLPPEDEPPQ